MFMFFQSSAASSLSEEKLESYGGPSREDPGITSTTATTENKPELKEDITDSLKISDNGDFGVRNLSSSQKTITNHTVNSATESDCEVKKESSSCEVKNETAS